VAFRLFCGQFLALAFLPRRYTELGCLEIEMDYVYDPECQVVAEYFRETYVHGRYNGHFHPPPLYSKNYWNQFQAMQDETERSNNHCEGNNTRLKGLYKDVLQGRVAFGTFARVIFITEAIIKRSIYQFIFLQTELFSSQLKGMEFEADRYEGDKRCEKHEKLLQKIAERVNRFLNGQGDRLDCIRRIGGCMLLSRIEKKCIR